MSNVLNELAGTLYAGDAKTVPVLVHRALDEGLTPAEVLGGGLIAGMDRVGVDFRNGELFVPEVLIAARAMHAGMNILRPLLAQSNVASTGVAMSALLTTTMPGMKHTIDALTEAGMRAQVKVIVGGAPVTEKFTQEIGADGYAPDAASAVELARSLVGKERKA